MGYKLDSEDFDRVFITNSELVDRFVGWKLWGFGANDAGQLGDNTTTFESSPIQTIAGGTNWKSAAVGQVHTAVIKTDGTLWMCGYNNTGQLGDGTIINKSSPVQTIAGGTNWKSVACGQNSTAAIKTDGTLWGWGDNYYGSLGDNTTIHKSSPVQTIAGGTNWKQVSGGIGFTVAIKTDGTLWGYGYNGTGQLADNTTINKSSPVQTIAGGANWKSVACGISTNAIKTDGTLWTWGDNYYGELGDNTTINKSSPVQTIAGGTNWKSVSMNISTAAIKTDGTLWTWGFNSSGQLGDNTTTLQSSPIQTIAGGTNWKSVSCGEQHTTAIKTDGTLWNWGDNSFGQLGDNTTDNKSSPVQTIAGGTTWKSVVAGTRHTIAIQYNDNL